MHTQNKANKTVTFDEIMDLHKEAFQQVQSISENHPEEARRLFVRLGLLQVDLIRSELEAMLENEQKAQRVESTHA